MTLEGIKVTKSIVFDELKNKYKQVWYSGKVDYHKRFPHG
jgi:hypothetical protein